MASSPRCGPTTTEPNPEVLPVGFLLFGACKDDVIGNISALNKPFRFEL